MRRRLSDDHQFINLQLSCAQRLQQSAILNAVMVENVFHRTNVIAQRITQEIYVNMVIIKSFLFCVKHDTHKQMQLSVILTVKMMAIVLLPMCVHARMDGPDHSVLSVRGSTNCFCTLANNIISKCHHALMQLCVSRHVNMADYVLDRMSAAARQDGQAYSVKHVSD